jgi:hypothetical protein
VAGEEKKKKEEKFTIGSVVNKISEWVSNNPIVILSKND